jgi:hypothetical protein
LFIKCQMWEHSTKARALPIWTPLKATKIGSCRGLMDGLPKRSYQNISFQQLNSNLERSRQTFCQAPNAKFQNAYGVLWNLIVMNNKFMSIGKLK